MTHRRKLFRGRVFSLPAGEQGPKAQPVRPGSAMRFGALHSLCVLFALVLVAPSSLAVESEAKSKTTASEFPQKINRFFSTYCVSCHGPDKQKGKLRLDTLSQDLVGGPHAEDWHEVLNVLNRGEMPPEKKKQPGNVERKQVIGYLTAAFKDAAARRRSTGGKAVMRRLTRYEYNNTMTDLLGVEMDHALSLPPESKSKDGFQNNGMAMGMSPIQLEYYLKAAREGLAKAIVEGDRPEFFKHINIKRQKLNLNRAARFKLDHDGLVLPGHARFAALKKYPRSGVVRIKVVLNEVTVPEGAGYPQMLIGVGSRVAAGGKIADFFRADVVPNQDGGPVEMVFTGRIDDVPLPESKSPVALVVANDYKPDAEYEKRKQKHFNAKRQLKKYEKLKARAKKQGKPAPRKPNIKIPELPVVPSFFVKSVSFEGPIYESWPPLHHRRILFERSSGLSEEAYASQGCPRTSGGDQTSRDTHA